MNPERTAKISKILEDALALDLGRRADYLDAACGQDADLRAEIDSLIDSHEHAGSRFLNEASLDRSPVLLSDAQPGRTIGPYRILQPIGQGGMGDVFSAVRADGHYEKKVAVKLVRAGHMSAGVLERFRAERQILAGLEHPNIARLLDGATTDNGIPYLVMELVEGLSIDAFCRARNLTVDDRLRLFIDVCSAVQFAHQRLVIHRDIKPGNILVTPEGIPKLLDFGIAKMLDPMGNVEATQLRPFTPEYASPEQIRGEPVSTATDAYSLGVVLYELLTGRSPYRIDTRTPSKLAEAITNQEPERPSVAVLRGNPSINEAMLPQIQRQLRGDLNFILLKALRKEPEARYSSAEHLADDIRRYLDGLPVIARKGTWSYRTSKFVRRHRVAVAAATLAFMTLVTSIIVTAREARIAEANRRRAEVRFNDVRKLANSLIYDVHDSIQNIPGATDARKLILDRSLEYLDSLSKESGNDPGLLRELATAYGRIGMLQGKPDAGNLGETNAAPASLRKSLELRKSLALSNPLNRADQIELAVTYLDFSDFQGTPDVNVSQAFEYCKLARAILDREAPAAPNDKRILLQSIRAYINLGFMQVGQPAFGRIGTTADGIANLQKALSLVQRAIELSPSDLEFRRREGTIELILADAFWKLGDRVQALSQYRHSLDIYDALNRKEDHLMVRYDQSVVLERIGNIALVGERPNEAISWYAKGSQNAAQLLAADPHNELLQRLNVTSSGTYGHALMETGRIDEGLRRIREGVAILVAIKTPTPIDHTLEGIGRSWIGEGLERQGRVAEATREYAKAKELFGALRAKEVNDVLTQVYFGSATLQLGNALSKLGKVDEGMREHGEALAILEPLSKANYEDQEILYALAETYTGQGTDAMMRAEHPNRRAENLADWQAAREAFQKSLNTWKRVLNPARISTTSLRVTLPAEVSVLLARCNREIRSLDTAPSR
jgi:non-specific serine/threonine protein kinase/serine/threonine-protein kinase